MTYSHWQIYKNIYLWSRIRNTQLNIPKWRLVSMFHSPDWQHVCPPTKRKDREGKKPEKIRGLGLGGVGAGVGHKTGILEWLQVRAGWNFCCLHTFLHHGLTNDPTHILYSLRLRNLFPSIFPFDPTATLWARQNWHWWLSFYRCGSRSLAMVSGPCPSSPPPPRQSQDQKGHSPQARILPTYLLPPQNSLSTRNLGNPVEVWGRVQRQRALHETSFWSIYKPGPPPSVALELKVQSKTG